MFDNMNKNEKQDLFTENVNKVTTTGEDIKK